MAHIVLKQLDSQVRSFALAKEVTTIGRSLANDITIIDPFVSRVHAKIIEKEGGYEILDLGAKHAVEVNGKIISRQRLKEGDKITLGSSLLIFQSEDVCAAKDVTFLTNEEMSEESVEVASFDSKKTVPFSIEDVDVKDFVTLHKDHQRLMLLYQFGGIINIYLEDIHHLLEEILSAVFKTLDAERGFIALVDEGTGELTCELVRDSSSGMTPERLEVSKTIIHKVQREGIAILTMNALKDSQFEKAKSIQEYSIRSAICAPLLFRGEVLGIVYLDNRASAGVFSEEDLKFLTAICHQAGIAMGNAHLHRQVVQENIRLENALRPKFEILGESAKMKKVFSTMKKVSPSDITVLIQGQTGTGKEIVAKAIHTLSPRAKNPFVAVNCAAIPRELIESELFGHEKGAFTGAISTRLGKFQIAHGGTIFLDEIGDMSLETQAKVLRTLEEKEFQRIGGTKTFQVDVRVIAATNKDLAKEVEKRKFREDLYYRLNVVSIDLPALRDRKKDIIPLAEHFAGEGVKISPQAKKLLLSYEWPGNVRELKNNIERAVVMGDGKVIQPEDLPHNLRTGGKIIPSPLESLEQLEEDHIIRVLRQTGWNKSDASRVLGITRQTLDNKIEKYKIKK